MKGKILVVDKSMASLTSLDRRLRRAGHEVLVANNGWWALRRSTAEKPDLILFNLTLPGMDRFEFCERLRANPSTAEIPVLCLLSQRNNGNQSTAPKTSANAYHCTPIKTQKLIGQIESLLAPELEPSLI